ncbi:Dihydropteroate synthase [hydrothermal vent metagenome]|uniref:dihydropteroate synthase n=1 Tax=hydrothermal vent metagenome TaxID=652676 RepID=A0A3B0VD92_9ZZZZ
MQATKSTRIMGILNITPDSFSDGGRLNSREAVARRIEEMIAAGADILDVGGESTRPFAGPVAAADELDRVLPVIKLIREVSDIPVSVDTTKAAVAAAALAAGAGMVNDISALRYDPEMVAVVRSYDGPVIIMHMQGTPDTMQIDPRYDDVVAEISAFFEERLTWLAANGIGRERVVIDPGIGFGKTVAHNLEILKNIKRFKETGCQVLVGHSRKSFIGKLLGLEVGERDCPTAVLSAFCAANGADIVRVHDVALNKQAVQLAALLGNTPP